MGKDDSIGQSFQELLSGLENQTSEFLESVADFFVGQAHPLRDGTELEPVELPRDLYAHDNAQTEWWYYTGHCQTARGHHFGFELVFFKRRTDLDKFSLVPLRLLGNPIYFAHFAITDEENKKFRYAHRKSANGVFDQPASMSDTHYHLRLGDWSIRESGDNHVLRASIGTEVTFEATLKPTKKVVYNGRDGRGVSFKDEGEASRYFSFTRMAMDGAIIWNGESEQFSGSAWMDREFGTWTPTENQKGWDWFSIQLENNNELMCYQLRNAAGGISDFSSGTFVDADGNSQFLTAADFEITPTGFWKSPHTQAVYPSGWEVKSDLLEIELTVAPVFEEQELDTRGTTMIVYWEGACLVEGKHRGENVSGRAYVELVGYDRSHDQPNLAYFLMGNEFEFPSKSFFR